MNNSIPLFCSFGIAVASFGSAAKHQAKQKPQPAKSKASNVRKVQRVDSSSPIDIPNLPLLHLSDALKQNSKTDLFKLTWFFSAGGFQSSGEAVYNRQSHTIKEDITEADSSVRSGGIYRYFYTKVDDQMILKVAESLGEKGSGPFSFGLLKPYGAIQYKRRKPS